MATFRVGVGSFNIKDSAVGIGTEGSGHGNLKVEGTLKSTSADVLGVSTFTRYSGFNADEININNRDLTLSGEYSTTGDIVVEDGASLTVGLGSTACVGSVECISVKNHFSVPSGDTAQRNETSGYAEGTVRYNIDLGTMEFFNGNEWRQFNYQADISNSPSSRGRVLTFGGKDFGGTRTAIVTSLQISTLGNAVYFGNMSVARRQVGACGSEIRSLTMGGSSSSADTTNEIHYYTIASEGDAIDFGDLLGAKQTCHSLSSSTRGISYGSGGSPYNQIDYVEIGTLGDAIDFGDTAVASRIAATANSPTRGFKIGGTDDSINRGEKEYITIASKGNGTEFDTARRSGPGGLGASNNVRAVIAGGYSYISPYPRYSDIEYFNMASLGESIHFGDLGRLTTGTAGGNSANQVRALFTGGYLDGSTVTDKIDYITFASTGNASDFGDLNQPTAQLCNASDSHGGLGGY